MQRLVPAAARRTDDAHLCGSTCVGRTAHTRKFIVNSNLGAEARHTICPVYEQCLPPWSLLANYERMTGYPEVNERPSNFQMAE